MKERERERGREREGERGREGGGERGEEGEKQRNEGRRRDEDKMQIIIYFKTSQNLKVLFHLPHL